MRRCLAILLLVAIACSGNDQTKEDQGRSIADAAGLSKEVSDFFAKAAAGLNATYRVTMATKDAAGQAIQLTTTQRPPDARFDSFNADGTIDSSISTGGRSYQCTMAANVWSCGELGPSKSSGEVFGADAVKAAIDRFKTRVADYDFRVESRTIASVTAQCLVTTRKPGHDADPTLGAAATLCLSPEGVIVLVEVPSGSASATAYTTTIPDDAFDLPASPTTTTSS